MSAQYLRDCLVKESAFRTPEGGVDRPRLAQARCLMLLFYLGFGAVLVSTVYCIFFAGRIEVMKTAYKQDQVEAPSIAICPFAPGTEIQYPEGMDRAQAIEVLFYDGLSGAKADGSLDDAKARLRVQSRECKFDRTCACADLWRAAEGAGTVRAQGGVLFSDHGRDARHDRVEVRTKLLDPSANHTLKIGLYDSVDLVPQWCYMAQGSYILGALELQTWTVSDLSWGALWQTLKGNYRATFSQRHIFRFTSQQVGARKGEASHISYEMQHFFVDDTVSSEAAVSPYSLLFLCFLLVVRSAVRDAFVSVCLPKHDPEAKKEPVRELSWNVEQLCRYTSCLVCDCLGREDKERQSLLDE